MKHASRLISFILLGISLSACGEKAEPTPTGLPPISDIYTAAAMTISAQSGIVTPTPSASPTTSPTIWSSPTLSAGTPTSQVTNLSYSSAYGCYDAAYVSDVTIPDGTILAPGEAFTKTWKIMNTGSCDWGASFLLAYETGTDMDGSNTLLGEAVAVGGTSSISVALVAPETEGSYTGYWRLATDNGEAFGGSVFVMIVVSEDAATATPTYTSTATSTTYVEDTPTYTPTPSTTPSSTPTEVEESTGSSAETPTESEGDGSATEGE